MKIIFISLSSVFTDGMKYQDNMLAEVAKSKGHDVIIVAGTYVFDNGNIVKISAGIYETISKIKVIRKEFKNIINSFISEKIRRVEGLYDLLLEEKPDIIFHHSLQTFELLTISKYVKNNNNCKFFADTHADYTNSAKNFLSKYLLHKIIYNYFINKSLSSITKIFYITSETKRFAQKMYNFNQNLMEFLPLGGIVIDDLNYFNLRHKVREKLNISNDELLFIHSGKLNSDKKSLEIIDAFNSLNKPYTKLIILGSVASEIETKFHQSIKKSSNIIFLDWVSGDVLFEYLIASDVYIQLGSQSATLQSAACSRNLIISYPHKIYLDSFGDKILYAKNKFELVEVILKVYHNKNILIDKSKELFEYSKNNLDYNKQLEMMIKK